MAQLPSLKDWNPGDSILSRSHHQQVVDALRLLGSPPPNPRFNYRVAWIGKIVEHGKDENDADTDDYEDARYHVQRLAIEAGVNQDGEDAAAFTPDETERVAKTDDDGIETGDTRVVNIFTVTNLPELAYREPQPDSEDESPTPPVLGCHLLSLGKIVRVWTEHDRANPNARRLVMSESPNPVRVRISSEEDPLAKGKYNAVALYDPQEDIATGSDLTQEELGEEGPDVIVLDPGFLNGGPVLSGTFSGKLIRVNEDGTAVIQLDGGAGAMFPVKVTPSGDPGSPTSTITLVYTVKGLDGTELDTEMVPENRPGYENCRFNQPEDGSPGEAYYDLDGGLHLYSVAEEWVKGDLVTTITSVFMDGNDLKYTPTKILVLEKYDDEDDVTVFEGTECPSPPPPPA